MNQTLPERASLNHLRGQARALLNDWQSGQTDRIQEYFSESKPNLARAQTVIAREYGFPSWSAIRRFVLESAFIRAISESDLVVAKDLFAKDPSLISCETEDGSLPLHIAVEHDDVDMTRWLISAGANLEPTYGDSAHTPLSWAITVNAFGAAHALIDAGAAADLFCLAGLGRLKEVRAMWIDGELVANASKTGSSRFDENGEPAARPPASAADQVSDALYIAARNGELETCRWLLDQGADPNFPAYMAATPLHWAEFSGNAELVELIRERGGDDTKIDSEFLAEPRAFGIIVPAAWGINRVLERNLSLHPDRVDLRGGYGTALNAAVWNRQIDSVRILLTAGASLVAENAHGLTALALARVKDFPEIVAELESRTTSSPTNLE